MNSLILVRHGQSIWNREKRFTGWADVELTEKGKSEANRAGELLKELNIEYNSCFSSNLKRAINTLKIILKILDKTSIEIIKTEALNERHYGGLTSLNKDEIIKKYGYKQVQIWRRSFNVAPPPMDKSHPYKSKINSTISQESLKETYERVIPFYNKKIEPLLLSKKNILVVFHGNSIRALLKKIFNISDKKIVDFEIPTGNPLLIRYENNLKIKDYKYLDSARSKPILFNV